MKLNLLKLAALAAVLLSAAVATAAPIFSGNVTLATSGSLSVEILAPAGASPQTTAIIDPGVEFTVCINDTGTCGAGLKIDIDLFDDSVAFTFTGATGAGGNFILNLSDFGFTPPGTIVGILPTLAALAPGTFTANFDSVDNELQFEGADDGVTANIAFEGTLTFTVEVEPTGTAPEPGGLALLGLALAAFGFTRRRRYVR